MRINSEPSESKWARTAGRREAPAPLPPPTSDLADPTSAATARRMARRLGGKKRSPPPTKPDLAPGSWRTPQRRTGVASMPGRAAAYRPLPAVRDAERAVKLVVFPASRPVPPYGASPSRNEHGSEAAHPTSGVANRWRQSRRNFLALGVPSATVGRSHRSLFTNPTP